MEERQKIDNAIPIVSSLFTAFTNTDWFRLGSHEWQKQMVDPGFYQPPTYLQMNMVAACCTHG